jgi:hypothetical protein
MKLVSYESKNFEFFGFLDPFGLEFDQEKTKEDYSSEEYVLILALIGTITHRSDTWVIDSDASKHMTG